MPFDTETERKVIKFMSWRQALYMTIGGLLFLSIASEILFAGQSFVTTVLLIVAITPITVPFLVLAFYKNKETDYYYDRYLLFVLNFKKKQSGIWRK